MTYILNHINEPQDLKKLNGEQLNRLASEIREALIKKVSVTGGHFGPNLGIIEMTIALHYVFNSPIDKMVYDVSHQCYCHKMLTGRKEGFLDESQFNQFSGFTNPDESAHDYFKIGHTSTSISLACGLAKARDLKGDKENIIAVIGDGSLSGGEALEGLDYALELQSNLIIVVNDNDISIAENHGGLYQNLKALRDSDGTYECNLFKAMGLDYVFVKDGNDIEALVKAFQSVKDTSKPVVVHICTQKGKGYPIAEQNKEGWHYCAPFDIETGKPIAAHAGENYSSITADYLLEKMKADPTVIAITSAGPGIMGFSKEKRKLAGGQLIDVGIAEEHAIGMASGIATNGGKPVYGTYSTFLQRTYDQLSQDVCINKSPVTILVYGASLYAMRDVTHVGIYDIAMISNIPNLVYLAPTTKEEYLAMVDWSIEQNEYPVAIRVPAPSVISTGEKVEIDFGKLNAYQVKQKGSKVAILGLGSFYELGEKVAEKMTKLTGEKPTLINPIYVTGVDEKLMESLKKDHDLIITLEDGILDGGFGEKIARFYGPSDMKVLNYGYKKTFLDRYNPEEVLEENRLTVEQIIEDIESLIK